MCDGLVKKADREALAAGVPVKVVSEQLGHAGVALTLDVYSHVLPHMQDDAAESAQLPAKERCRLGKPSSRLPARS